MKNSKGFTLVEIAVVLLIVSILLGYTVAMAPRQQELKQYKKAKLEMKQITEAIYSFAQVKGYLPCPALDGTSNGFECRTNGGTCDGNDVTAHTCGVWFGILPGKTLGIDGRYSAQGAFLDPWGEPYRYQVSNTDNDLLVTNLSDFVISGEMRVEGISNLNPDLAVCNADPSPSAVGADSDCLSTATRLINDAPVVISSLGKNRNKDVPATSWVERENLDNGNVDRVFISSAFSDDFDDLVQWISPNILYSKMIEAGQLP